MFAAVFFAEDEQFDCINIKKIKRTAARIEDEKFEINKLVVVPYKTRMLDESGREKDVDVDYKGTILYLNKDKSVVCRFLEDKEQVLNAVRNETLTELVEAFDQNNSASKRKVKKTGKMLAFIDDECEGTSSTTTSKGKDASTAKSTKKKMSGPASESAVHTETRKIQTLEYFKKKKVMQGELNNLTPTKRKQTAVFDPEADSPGKSTQSKTSKKSAPHTPKSRQTAVFGPEADSPAKSTRSKTPTKSAPHTPKRKQTAVFGPEADSPAKSTQSKTPTKSAPRTPGKEQTGQPKSFMPEQSLYQPLLPIIADDWDSTTADQEVYDTSSVSAAVGQGFAALYGREFDNLPCIYCSKTKEEMEKLEEENKRLKAEIEDMRNSQRLGKSSVLLDDLKKLVQKYDPAEKTSTSMDTHYTTLDTHYTTLDTQYTSTSSYSSLDTLPSTSSSEINQHSNCYQPTQMTSPSSKVIDNVESVDNFRTFFEPGENKIRLVEGHNLFINTTKLNVIKSKAKKNPKKVIRDLLSYYFKPEYLAVHSATGAKSSKKGLPVEIVQPLREFINKNYRFDDTNMIINRKCLDTARKLGL